MIDKNRFFNSVKADLFGGKLTRKQVEGMDEILNHYEVSGWNDLRWLSYLLATVFHETGQTMQPVTEFGGEAYLRKKEYYPYYGRDLVQTSWRANYKKVKEFSGIDVVANPSLIAQLPLAVKVAFKFMEKGWYTGRALSKSFNETTEDPISARKIINGTDRAELIASYYYKFIKALS